MCPSFLVKHERKDGEHRMQRPTGKQPPVQGHRHWWNDGELFLHGLVRSNYITALEEWFMGLAGKAVNIVLMVTVLYSCAEIYVSLPAAANTTMFLIQMAALDIGGYGLATLARVARRDGDATGAKQATWLGRGLISVMLVSVVVAGLEQRITLPEAVKAGIDLTLIVIRSACSVFYGKVVHALKSDHPQLPARSDLSPVDVQQLLTQTISELQATIEQHLAEIVSEQQQLILTLQQGQAASPAVDSEALADAGTTRLEALSAAAMGQQIPINEASEALQIAAPKPRHEAKRDAASDQGEAGAGDFASRQPSTSAEKRGAVFALLRAGETRSSYQLASIVGCSASTIQRYRRAFREARERGGDEAR